MKAIDAAQLIVNKLRAEWVKAQIEVILQRCSIY